jgi:hypothetical protein
VIAARMEGKDALGADVVDMRGRAVT